MRFATGRKAPRPRFLTPLALTFALTALGIPLALRGAGGAGNPAPARHFTFFYTAEVHGTLEPCGCTSDPLGDVARYAAVVKAARRQAGDVLLVDAGGLSFPEGGSAPRERTGNRLRADFLASALARVGLRAAGLAEADLAPGGGDVSPRRSAVNLSGAPGLAPPAIESVNGVKVGVFGVADPALAAPLHAKAEEPVAAARREAERLRRAGAELVIALAPVERAVARRLAREAAVDFVVLGRQVGRGLPRAEAVGHAFLLAPADELQKVGRVDVVLRGGGLTDAGGPEATALRQAELGQALARLDEELSSWTSGAGAASADQAFVVAKRREREALAAERAALNAGAWNPPAQGSYFVNRLIPLRRSLPREPAVAAALRRLDVQIGKVNLRDASPPPAAEPGRPFYVGMAKCASCHKTAEAFWRKTVHAHAWKTLVDGGKQADYKCVGCHVTGYGQLGGSSLGHTVGLENVQCETCHGPGSEHVAGKGLEDPPAIQRDTPSPTCSACHNEHHSDTFLYQAYLRDVLGPGHGASARARLGDGPTGRSLRSAALAKAKVAGRAAQGKL